MVRLSYGSTVIWGQIAASLLLLLLSLASKPTDGLQPLPVANRADTNLVERQGIRLVTWNLLAPVFSHPQKYPWCSAEALSWPFREKLIVELLQETDADVICLQEVQTDLWEGFLQHFSQSYDGILQNVTNQHPVTNAILLKKNKFQVIQQESRSRALILVLDHLIDGETNSGSTDSNKNNNNPLYLANVHLQAGMEDDETRMCQLKSLLKRLNTHSSRITAARKSTGRKKAQKSSTTKAKSPSCVVVGDFNMLPTNPVYYWLSETNSPRHQIEQGNKKHFFFQDGKQKLSKLMFPMNGKHNEILPLKDVHIQEPPPVLIQTTKSTTEKQHDDDTIQMTYCGGGRLDYIWTLPSSSIDVVKTMVFHPQAFEKSRQQWPSNEHPSDHLPVGFEFTW
ncbi:repressible alcohol dehydrogenase transcriptional effector [Seminavis robusta]|uniref:Repressible alcohol dehydrogenase transcriptional effector n=1 Tax=Seminavis robusta TaxID=568900 RepID=A0A9N8DNI3_9STRA|nr:repressible alcohol dehydrogenase transcriptional effector [Seminavis robusta]|eukprot:Sro246_g097750.1 repressible alcohol dehydrogenase transcriptional effector (395) ;mRNA; f:50442-51626